MTTTLIFAIRLADVLLVALVLVIMLLAALPHVAPRLGYDPLVIRGGSMEPAIPIGSLVFVQNVDSAAIRVGDVVTIKADNDVVFTHRVIGITTSGDALSFQTQGDANESPDVALAPSRAIVGRVASFVPTLGYLLVILSTTKGMLTALALGAFLFLFGRLVDDLRGGAAARQRSTVAGAER